MHDAAGEAALVQQLEVDADPPGASRVPPPTTTGDDEQVELVDQPGRDRLGGEVGAADAEVARPRPPSAARTAVGVEGPLEPGAGASSTASSVVE